MLTNDFSDFIHFTAPRKQHLLHKYKSYNSTDICVSLKALNSNTYFNILLMKFRTAGFCFFVYCMFSSCGQKMTLCFCEMDLIGALSHSYYLAFSGVC